MASLGTNNEENSSPPPDAYFNDALGLFDQLDESDLQEALGVGSYLSNEEELPLGDRHEANSDANTATAKRRKHRESMARLRHKLRSSIDLLQLEEKQLEQRLESTLASFRALPSIDPRWKLQRAYYELVKEQLAVREERASLEKSWSRKDSYGRLLQRELGKVSDGQQDASAATRSAESTSE